MTMGKLLRIVGAARRIASGAATSSKARRIVALAAGAVLVSAVAIAAETVSLKSAAAAKGRYFGAALDPAFLAEPGYRKLAVSQFSSITPENAMKWQFIEPAQGVFNWTEADEVAAFARANHQKLRGHNLLWEGHLPSWATDRRLTATALQELIEKHVRAEVGRYKGAVYAWDVVNEPFADDGGWRAGVLHDTLGPNYVAIALRAARGADPHAKLYLNEYNVEYEGPKFSALYNLVASLKRSGAPIDGVGLQSHFIEGQAPRGLRAALAKFAALDIDVAITELDLRIASPASPESLARQAEDYRFVIDACLAVARCVGVTSWGISDNHSWIPAFFAGYGQALLFDERGNRKPAYAAAIDAFRK
jgi:endo-1,4-beta-xylanase